MKYFDKHNNEILAGMDILCLIDNSTERVYERVYEGVNSSLGILGDSLEDLPPSILPLYWFAHEQDETGYTLYQFEIIHR